MTASSLPSTLVKCLYLFFDLPESSEPKEKSPDSTKQKLDDTGQIKDNALIPIIDNAKEMTKSDGDETPEGPEIDEGLENRIILQKIFVQVNFLVRAISFNFSLTIRNAYWKK